MPVKRLKARQSLLQKGFRQHNRDHQFFIYYHQGHQTTCYTYLSYGAGSKEIGDDLLQTMKRELHLDSLKQVRDLLECPMDEQQLGVILSQKGLLRD